MVRGGVSGCEGCVWVGDGAKGGEAEGVEVWGSDGREGSPLLRAPAVDRVVRTSPPRPHPLPGLLFCSSALHPLTLGALTREAT